VAAVPETRRPELVVSAYRFPGQWQLMVTDNGVGVQAKDRTRIFEAFQRGEASHRGGTGLGLAICKAVVERHGGRIWVEAAPTGGSRFAFTLPVAAGRSPLMPATSAPARVRTGSPWPAGRLRG
jgi:signal transduction histidine kinase